MAATASREWLKCLPDDHVVAFSDRSSTREGRGYSYAIYQAGKEIRYSTASISPYSVVFDTEAVGAWRALQHIIGIPPEQHQRQIWVCLDNTTAIWYLRGNPSNTSQGAFPQFHRAMETYNVQVKWVPGHCKVEGNKRADKLAKEGVKRPQYLCAGPTVAGIRAMARIRLQTFEVEKWRLILSKLSRQYRAWELDLTQGCPAELYLSRKELHRLLTIRTRHGDFRWYHMKFKH